MVFSVLGVCVFIGSHVSHQSGRVHQFDGNEFRNDCAGRSHFFPPDPGPRIAVFHRLYGERRRQWPVGHSQQSATGVRDGRSGKQHAPFARRRRRNGLSSHGSLPPESLSEPRHLQRFVDLFQLLVSAAFPGRHLPV